MGIVYTVMDDKMSSRTLDPSKLRVDDCLAVLKHRSEKLHTNDRRAQLLKAVIQYPPEANNFPCRSYEKRSKRTIDCSSFGILTASYRHHLGWKMKRASKNFYGTNFSSLRSRG